MTYNFNLNYLESKINRLEKVTRLFIEKFWKDLTEDEKQKNNKMDRDCRR